MFISFFKNKSKLKIFILQAKPPQMFQENEELKIEIQCLKKFFFIKLKFAARNEPDKLIIRCRGRIFGNNPTKCLAGQLSMTGFQVINM